MSREWQISEGDSVLGLWNRSLFAQGLQELWTGAVQPSRAQVSKVSSSMGPRYLFLESQAWPWGCVPGA